MDEPIINIAFAVLIIIFVWSEIIKNKKYPIDIDGVQYQYKIRDGQTTFYLQGKKQFSISINIKSTIYTKESVRKRITQAMDLKKRNDQRKLEISLGEYI